MIGLNTFLLIILIFLILGLGTIVYLFLHKKEKESFSSESLLLLQQQVNQIAQVLDTKLSESNKNVQEQFRHSLELIRNFTERLAQLNETNRQIIGFVDQLKSLQDVLKNPKQRSVVGEYFLETVLKNVLPPGSFQMQYSFSNGERVDAVIFIDKKIIPIDSKFSLENYNKLVQASDPLERKKWESAFINDLKLRIEETAKYIRPAERTMDFAFMFIPSEAIYYDLLINKVGSITEETNNLIYYAWKKKVIIVSPTSFVAYLQTVLQGLRNQKISEQAQTIIKEVERLGRHLFVYSEYMKRLGQHLQNTVNSYNKASEELEKIDKDVVKITSGESQIEIKKVEFPLNEK